MSIDAIRALETFLQEKDKSISVLEIKEKIKLYVEERDAWERLHPRGYYDRAFIKLMSENRMDCVREGRRIERTKLRDLHVID